MVSTRNTWRFFISEGARGGEIDWGFFVQSMTPRRDRRWRRRRRGAISTTASMPPRLANWLDTSHQ
jgi:hypothetical protein